jgi:hypothetical protein
LPLPGAGYADFLGVTPEGEVALAEVKLGRNSEARREILAQALDYWRALRRISCEDLEAACLRASPTRLSDSEGLYEVSGAAEEGRIGPVEFRARVAERLRTGRVLLLLVLDRAPDELVRLVSDALSDQPAFPFEIGLVEVGIHDAPGGDIVLAPRLRGAVLTRTRAVVRLEGPLALDPVIEESGRNDGSAGAAARPARTLDGLLAEINAKSPGLGARFSGFLAKAAELGVRAEIARSAVLRLGEVNIGSADADARLNIYFTEAAREAGREPFEEYLRTVAALSGRPVSADKGTGEPRLAVPLSALLDAEPDWFDAIRRYRDATERGAAAPKSGV